MKLPRGVSGDQLVRPWSRSDMLKFVKKEAM
jgi:hypothetical protein